MTAKRMSGIRGSLAATGDTRLSTKEAADAIGISTETLNRWRKIGLLTPESKVFGAITAFLFNEKDIEEAIVLKNSIKSGRRCKGDTSIRVSHSKSEQLSSIVAINKLARKKALLKRMQNSILLEDGAKI